MINNNTSHVGATDNEYERFVLGFARFPVRSTAFNILHRCGPKKDLLLFGREPLVVLAKRLQITALNPLMHQICTEIAPVSEIFPKFVFLKE
jgi:hypothetical protein